MSHDADEGRAGCTGRLDSRKSVRSAPAPDSDCGSVDSLEEGKSYYFAEIEALLRLIEAGDSPPRHVFVIDEILHGTNTVERIACAAAILDRLSADNTVLVTTHDVELGRLLPERYRAFHFWETSDPENMFDYRLREGHCTTRNAIALLAAIGFPPDIIDDARRVASDLER